MKWCANKTWSLTFIKDLAIHLPNRHQECYCALTSIIQNNATRKIQHTTTSTYWVFNDFKILIRFDGSSFEEASPSKVSHQDTLGMANYLGKALTTGCYTGGACAARTEILDLSTQRWTDAQDYPYTW